MLLETFMATAFVSSAAVLSEQPLAAISFSFFTLCFYTQSVEDVPNLKLQPEENSTAEEPFDQKEVSQTNWKNCTNMSKSALKYKDRTLNGIFR